LLQERLVAELFFFIEYHQIFSKMEFWQEWQSSAFSRYSSWRKVEKSYKQKKK